MTEAPPLLPRPSRRDALRLLAAHLPLALAGCGKPREEIVPYVTMPEELASGEALRFASVLPLSGIGRGIIATSVEGRPIKISGNPKHPASLGATDTFAEASILSLYDPDRSSTPLEAGKITSWAAFEGRLTPMLDSLRARGGEGMALLTGRAASPTFGAQIVSFLKAYPRARWFAYDPLDDAAARSGTQIAFGQCLDMRPDFAAADIVLSLGADFLGPGPDQIAFSRAYMTRRLAEGRPSSRLHVLESTPSVTGAKADGRYVATPATMSEILLEIANRLGANRRTAELDDRHRSLAERLLIDLQSPQAKSLVLTGPTLSAEAHAVGHWINAKLSAPVTFISPVDAVAGHEPEGLPALAKALDANAIAMLAIIDVNPVYDAPADLGFTDKLERVATLIHAGLYRDETALRATWHLPLSHPLEAWGDWRSADGTAAIAQPLIEPLHATRTQVEILAYLAGTRDANCYELVRQTWQTVGGDSFEAWWSSVLKAGIVPASAAAPVTTQAAKLPKNLPRLADDTGLQLVLVPDPCLYDGTFANNAWLQELPNPLTKQVWGNALQISAKDAAALDVETGDVVEIGDNERTIEGAVLVTPGHADGVVSLSLGLGRDSAGMIGNKVGANAYALRTTAHSWIVPAIRIRKTGRKEEVLIAQRMVRTSDIGMGELQKRFPVLLEKTERLATPAPRASLYAEQTRKPADHAWAMVIDNAACIGCNACIVACQAENNIPVVGPDEIEIGRFMQWLRIDIYDFGRPEQPFAGFQPVPCMHCEKAPCEPVCPVEASVHDGEGLNAQVYNRCIGTRFCEANCPYKVRRFNFRAYADGEEYANLGADSYRAQKNPDVTVRSRGVMEKCTYCVQRLSAARRREEREDRSLYSGEVATACQDACPTRAITFGDLARGDDPVARLKTSPRHYTLLGELDTRPRTTYLADWRQGAVDISGASE